MSVQPFSGPIPALVRDFLKTKVRIDKLHVKNEGGEWVEKRGPFIKGNMLNEESSGLTVIDRASGEKRTLNSLQEIRKEHFRWWRVIVMEFDAEDTLLAQREALSKLPIPPTLLSSRATNLYMHIGSSKNPSLGSRENRLFLAYSACSST